MPDILNRLHAAPVDILAGRQYLIEDGEDNSPKWVIVAKSGEYRGYNGSADPFTFDKAVFDQITRNLRAHPSYKRGTDGYGTTRIVPWDYEHSSTHPPSEGSLPVSGSPAQGWSYDFDVRKGDHGEWELWSLTEFLEPARSYIRAGKYRWASVSLVFDAVNPRSGENVGATIMSIALTNSPFIEGMQELVASKGAALSDHTPHKSEEETMDRILKALSVKSLDEAVERIANLLADSAELSQLKPEIEQLRANASKSEEEQVESDVAEAMASHGLATHHKEALLLLRKQLPARFAELYQRDRDGDAEFRARLARNGSARIFEEVATSRSGAPLSPGGNTPVGIDHGQGGAIDLGRYVGETTFERAMDFIVKERNGKNLPWEALCKQAHRLKQEPGVIDTRVKLGGN
jgi:hypothetical protein